MVAVFVKIRVCQVHKEGLACTIELKLQDDEAHSKLV
jgi:hypothetical protein